MRPGLVDEVFAGTAARSDVSSAFAARHNMVPTGGHLPVTECARFVHAAGATILLKHIHILHRLKVSAGGGAAQPVPPAHPRARELQHDSTQVRIPEHWGV